VEFWSYKTEGYFPVPGEKQHGGGTKGFGPSPRGGRKKEKLNLIGTSSKFEVEKAVENSYGESSR